MSKKLIFLDLDQTIICNTSHTQRLSEYQKNNASNDGFSMQVADDGTTQQFSLLHQSLHTGFFCRLSSAVAQGKAEFRVLTAAIYPEQPVVDFLTEHFKAASCLPPTTRHRVINRSSLGNPFGLMSAVNAELTGEGKAFHNNGNALFGMGGGGVWVDKVVQAYYLIHKELNLTDQSPTDVVLIDDAESHRKNMQLMNYSTIDSTAADYPLQIDALLKSLDV